MHHGERASERLDPPGTLDVRRLDIELELTALNSTQPTVFRIRRASCVCSECMSTLRPEMTCRGGRPMAESSDRLRA
jgi:hypothetical protein